MSPFTEGQLMSPHVMALLPFGFFIKFLKSPQFCFKSGKAVVRWWIAKEHKYSSRLFLQTRQLSKSILSVSQLILFFIQY